MFEPHPFYQVRFRFVKDYEKRAVPATGWQRLRRVSQKPNARRRQRFRTDRVRVMVRLADWRAAHHSGRPPARHLSERISEIPIIDESDTIRCYHGNTTDF